MNRFNNFISIALLLVAILHSTGCTRVEPGYVAIKVNNYGSQKGVEDFPLRTGRVWYNPFTQTVYKFPTFMQHKAWTASKTEGSPNDESITFNSAEGASLTADIGFNYTLNPEKVPHLFVKHRQTIKVITDRYLRNRVRDAFNRCGGNYKAVQILGEKKQSVLSDAAEALAVLEEDGFLIDNLSFISAPRGDHAVMTSINTVIQATQEAIKAENEVRQAKAEAQKMIAAADGQAESILAVANAKAEANRILNQTLTPALIRYRAIEQWDGVAPRVFGGGETGMLLSIPTE